MRRVRPAPWVLTALAAIVYVVLTPPTTDLAAQVHRVALARDGVWLYDLSWFGGHHLPSYSVLMPLAGLVVAPQVLAAVAAVAAAWAFGRLAERHRPGAPARAASWWFAAGTGALLFTGRVTFVLGVAIALVTLVVVVGAGPGRGRASGDDRGRDAGGDAPRGDDGDPGARAGRSRAGRSVTPVATAAAGAIAAALASPVAALFLALVGLAWWIGDRRIVPAVLTAVAFGTAVALAIAFPGGGSEPFVASALLPAIVGLAAALVVIPARERTLRIGVALYLAGVVLAGMLDTPMGGN
ncbi:MAG: hypothetical protein AB7G37_20340, partial [Solirubrobacteraceae bacterium]